MDSTIIDTDLGNNAPEKKGRIIIKNLDEDQKKQILSKGGTALLGLLGGAASFSLMSFVDESDFDLINSESDIIEVEEEIEEPIIIYTEAPFAESVSDDMSFSEAYQSARAEVGAGGIFEWKGNTYNTYTKDEWDSLTEEDRQDYLSSITDRIEKIEQENIDDNNSEELIADLDSELNSEADNDIDADLESGVLESELLGVTEDLDGDGVIDIVGVDYNKNDMIDVMIDTDGDGKMDQVILDYDEEVGLTGNEEIIDLENDVEQDVIIDNDSVDTSTDDTLIAENSDIDRFDDAELNPDYDIDNDVDMTEYS